MWRMMEGRSRSERSTINERTEEMASGADAKES